MMVPEKNEKYENLVRYIRNKINHMLEVVGTKALRDEELTDDMLIELDPIGIVTDSFQQILDNLKKTNEDLLISKNEIEAIFNSIGVGLMVIDRESNIIASNRMYKEMFQCTDRNIIGEKCYRVNCETESPPPACNALEIFSSGKQVQMTNWERKKKKFELVGTPIKDSSGEIIYAVITYFDITEKIRMEQELLKNQKLESLSIMAAGIAHDFNNMLTAAFSTLSLMKLKIEDRDALLANIENTEKALNMAKNLVRQVSTFAIGGAPLLSAVNIEEAISNICEFTMCGSNCTLSMKFEKGLHPVDVDITQFNQVINNMIINSQQAMPDGGKIDITVVNRTLGSGSKIPLPEGDYIEISIKDSGHGIPEEHIANIFDPFYTTKTQGSGIGLATSYSIIRRHKGYISVDSKPGSWTEFRIYLPKSDTSLSRLPVAETCAGPGNKKSVGNILVMDDDKMILKATGALLKASGYEVDTAPEGEAALAKIADSIKNKKPYDLVIFDLVVPGGMGGLKAIKKLLELNAGIKAIVSSGYSNDEVLVNYSQYGFDGIVLKPYKMEELFAEVNRVLLGKKSA